MASKKNKVSKFPLPVDETERLKALYDLCILDTDPELSFERIVRLAKILFETRICAISLIDHDRQWFKAIAGFNCSETPREIAFCTHTILSGEPLIVPDATLHPLFKDNPLVVGEPYIRFYAGIPLQTREGSKVGTLCVIDTEPQHDWNRLRTAILSEMAKMVCYELENRSLKQRERYLLALNRQLQFKLAQKGNEESTADFSKVNQAAK